MKEKKTDVREVIVECKLSLVFALLSRREFLPRDYPYIVHTLVSFFYLLVVFHPFLLLSFTHGSLLQVWYFFLLFVVMCVCVCVFAKAVRVRNNLISPPRFFFVSSIVPGNAIINLGARARVTFIRK